MEAPVADFSSEKDRLPSRPSASNNCRKEIDGLRNTQGATAGRRGGVGGALAKLACRPRKVSMPAGVERQGGAADAHPPEATRRGGVGGSLILDFGLRKLIGSVKEAPPNPNSANPKIQKFRKRALQPRATGVVG